MIDFKQESREVEQVRSQLDHLERTIDEETKNTEEATEAHLRAQDAQEILQRTAQAVQRLAHERIASVVSSCLSSVFDDPYEFKIEFERKRGRTEAVLQFTRHSMVVDPLSACGGGVVDVAAFALRVACLMLHRPRISKVVVLDEPFKFVSADYQPKVRTMLEKMSKELGLQIILVTHINELETGKIIQV